MVLGMSAVGFTWYRVTETLDTRNYANSLYKATFSEQSVPETDKLNRLFYVLSSLPELAIKDGELVLNDAQAISLKDPLFPDTTLVTLDATSTAKNSTTDARVTLTRDAMLLAPSDEAGLAFFYHDFLLNDQSWNGLFATINALPNLQIKDGIASMDNPSPYMVHNLLDQPAIYFDTDTAYWSDTLDIPSSTYIAFFAQELAYWPDSEHEAETVALRYTDLTKDDLTLLFDTLLQRATSLLTWSGILALFPVTGLLFLVTIAIISLLAVVTQAIAKHQHIHQLEYRDCQRLTAVAFTPVLILKGILPEFAMNNLIFFLMALGYIYFAIQANKEYGRSHG